MNDCELYLVDGDHFGEDVGDSNAIGTHQNWGRGPRRSRMRSSDMRWEKQAKASAHPRNADMRVTKDGLLRYCFLIEACSCFGCHDAIL